MSRTSRFTVIAFMLASSLGSTAISRADEQLAATATTAASAEPGKAPRTHDGFYLRLGAGLGETVGAISRDDGGDKVHVKGLNIASEVAVGTTILPGLVIGGGAFPMIVPSPSWNVGDRGAETSGAHHISGIGPFIDGYWNPRGGLHFQAALLFTAGVVNSTDLNEGQVGFGFGEMLGVGYEWFIADQWSIGPIVRLVHYHLRMKGHDTGAKATFDLVSPSLLVGLTWH